MFEKRKKTIGEYTLTNDNEIARWQEIEEAAKRLLDSFSEGVGYKPDLALWELSEALKENK